jgi:pyrroloquinoline quinone biosynthesis protein D
VSLEAYPRILPKARIQTDRITGERTLLYPEGVLILNPTSAAIVDLCDGSRNVRDVIGILAERYDAAISDIERDVLDYLDRLNSICLLGLHGEPSE